MKLHLLLLAAALAAGSAFAQSNYGGEKSSTAPAAGATVPKEEHKATKAKAKKTAKKHHKAHHAAARHHGQRHARAARHDARAMGAAASGPSTDLNAGARQRRMDDAYANWRARQ